MNSEIEKKDLIFSFEIKDKVLGQFTHLKLFNGFNKIVDECYGDMNITVPKGLYKLRIEMNEHVEDRDYRIVGDTTDYLEQIQSSSAMPVNGLTSTYDNFSIPTSQWSAKSTITQNSIGYNDSSFFLFMSYMDKEKKFQESNNPLHNFLIIDSNREILYDVKEQMTKSNSGKNEGSEQEIINYFGWIAFHEKLDPGQYYLIFGNEREIPIYVFEGWQTQMYLVVKETPVFGSLRISIEKQGFSKEGRQNLELDALIQKMYNGIYFLPKELQEAAIHGKWENPMLGILSAYMYLLTDTSKDDSLYKEILTNLQERILRTESAPDLIALRLLGAIHFKLPLPNEPLIQPCMVAAGLNGYLSVSYQNENLLPKNGIVEAILKNMHADSIWTSYTPLPVKKPELDPPSGGVHSDSDLSIITSGTTASQAEKSEIASSEPTVQNDWITSTILNRLGEKPITDIADFAAQLQVTTNTIKSSLDKLKETGNLISAVNTYWPVDSKTSEIQNTFQVINKNLHDIE